MVRYEGMDELIERVRERLEVADDRAPTPFGESYAPASVLSHQLPYESALENLLLLLHEAEQLQERLTPGRIYAVTREQREDLQSVLTRVMQQLSSCEAALQRFSHRE